MIASISQKAIIPLSSYIFICFQMSSKVLIIKAGRIYNGFLSAIIHINFKLFSLNLVHLTHLTHYSVYLLAEAIEVFIE